jgi:hypothetical protein
MAAGVILILLGVAIVIRTVRGQLVNKVRGAAGL